MLFSARDWSVSEAGRTDVVKRTRGAFDVRLSPKSGEKSGHSNHFAFGSLSDIGWRPGLGPLCSQERTSPATDATSAIRLYVSHLTTVGWGPTSALGH
jgi:hypothetical protein